MTATATPTLAEALASRWTPDVDHPSHGNGDDVVLDAAAVLKAEMVGAYWQWDDDEGRYASDEPLAPGWLDHLHDEIAAAARAAWQAHVVPAAAAAIVEYMRQNPPPPHLVAFEKSEQLRSDLAALR